MRNKHFNKHDLSDDFIDYFDKYNYSERLDRRCRYWGKVDKRYEAWLHGEDISGDEWWTDEEEV